MRNRWRFLGSVGAGSILLLATSIGCGGGGGGGGGGPTQPPIPPPPQSGVTFTPSSPTTPNSVHLAGGSGGSATVFVLDVRVNNVEDVYGVSFTLDFPRNLLSWRKNATTEGSFLTGDDGARTELVIQNRPAGSLVIGYSRLGEVPGVSGSGTLFSLEFVAESSGSGELIISREDLVGALGEIQSDVTWIDGSVDVTVSGF